jgi:hypothetical protein
MKRNSLLIITSLLVAGALWLASCSDKEPEVGMLTINVINPQSGPVPWEWVYLATSLENLQNKVYADQAQTTEQGWVKFDTLTPGIYWYDTEHWEDYGAVGVYLGIDTRAVLWVNTPGPGKK